MRCFSYYNGIKRLIYTEDFNGHMIYLDSVYFAGIKNEEQFINYIRRTCVDSFYPFGILPRCGLDKIDFSTVTILYGGNGCGKSTALNIIAALLGIEHHTVCNTGEFMKNYLEFCDVDFHSHTFERAEILKSDDVFDRMIDIRKLNNGIDTRREDAYEEYLHLKSLNASYSGLSARDREEIEQLRMHPMENYEKLVKKNLANSKTQSKFVRATVADNIREQSNGESAFEYFCKKITDNGIYLLDEPENSLSPERQRELVRFLEDSARFYGCQFIIATHSPFLLAMKGARIYDMSENPVTVKHWTELGNVREYYNFFREHDNEFK